LISGKVIRRRLGRCGFKVPAVTFSPSDNIAFANCLASISFGNALVCLGDGARDEFGRHWLGASVETYQRLLIKRIGIPERATLETGHDGGAAD
jgi:hypothetical protein